MNVIKIPKSFSLFGHTIRVKLLKSVNKGKDYADWDFDKKEISLEKISDKFTQEQQSEYFLHECLHGILDHLGYKELSNDEPFIEQTSRLLMQVLKTAEY